MYTKVIKLVMINFILIKKYSFHWLMEFQCINNKIQFYIQIYKNNEKI